MLLTAYVWNNALGGNWDDGSKWTPNGIPGVTANDTATINLPGTYTVSLSNTARSIDTLTLGAASGTQTLAMSVDLTLALPSTVGANGAVAQSAGNLGGAGNLTVNGSYAWSGGGMMGGGKTTIASGGTLSMSNNVHDLDRILDDNGPSTWTGGDLRMNGGTFNNNNNSLTVNTGGTTLQCYGNGSAGPNAFNNNAGSTFTKQGSGTLQFVVSSSAVPFNNNASVDVQAGTLNLNAGGTQTGDFSVAAAALLAFDGTQSFSAAADITGLGSLNVVGGNLSDAGTINIGTATFSGGTAPFSGPSFRTGTLNISGGTAVFAAGGNITPVVNTLSVTSGKLDLNDNDLIVDYTGASQLAAVQAFINSARTGGTWNGNGLTSTSARNNPQHNTTLGAMEASDYKSLYGAAAPFDSQSIDTTAVLVKYTYYGDTDFNGKVNFDDYVRADSGFNNHRSGWLNGDFDGNGSVNFDDYVLIDLAFNTQGGPLRRGTR